MRTYLMLAGFWLLAAALVFGYPLVYPQAESYTIRGTDLSIGWLLLLFAGWCLLRWWTTRPARSSDGTPDAKR